MNTARASSPSSITLVHERVRRVIGLQVVRNDASQAIVRCQASGKFDINCPGQLIRSASATFRVRLFVEPVTPVGDSTAPADDGQFEIEERNLPVTLSIYTPDGLPFTAGEVTLADLLRFRDARGVTHGQWSFSLEGETDPIEEDDNFKVVQGTGRMRMAIVETIDSKSAAPLVADLLDDELLRHYTFDLFRVGAFSATARPVGTFPTSGARELRLIDPDGVRVASGRGRLRFDVGLQTLGKSRDAQGQPRLWTLEVLPTLQPSPFPTRPQSSAIGATVVASARVHVQSLQSRIDRLIGTRGSKLEIFGETQGDDVLARLRILDVETAETIDMHSLLDDVIGSVAQDPGVDKDIRAGVPYTLARESRDLGKGLMLSLSGVKVGAIDIAVGASEQIQPPIPALKVGVEVAGEVTVSFHGFPLATAKIRDGRLRLEAGMAFDATTGFVARTWMNDGPVDVDLHWAAALAAGILSPGLLLLGAEGVAELIESSLNSMLPRVLQSIVEKAVARAPLILAMMLGDHFTYRGLRLEGDDFVFDHDAPIEPDPKPDPHYTPILGRSAVQLGPDAWRLTPPTLGDTWAAGNLAKVDHVVVVMMENRSFDHVLGYRAELEGTAPSNGLTAALREFLRQQGFPMQGMSDVARIPLNSINLRTAFPRGVGHDLKDVVQQLSARLTTPEGRAINSPKGFVENFRSRAGDLLAEDVLGFYKETDLPFSAFLAQQYGFSDRYFCSHPGPTLPNRMLSLSGDVQHDRTGAPTLDNNDSDNFFLSRAPTIYDLLTRFGVSWRVYETFPSVTMLRMFARYATNDTDIVDISHFFAAAAAGTLPALSVVEPAMHHFPQNDDHSSNNNPAVDMYRGQQFLRGIYEALRSNPKAWEKTLLLITYDEHGGFYDHAVPPLAEARSKPPVIGGATLAGADRNAYQVPATVTTPYGVRVPTFVVSPWVPAGKGPDIVLDHCSILKTVLARFCPTRPFLSDRVHASRSFDAFLSAQAPRLAVPAPPELQRLTEQDPGVPGIITPPISRKQMRAGSVGFHELTGMLARLLGR